uniref:Warm temperature acclimation protein 65 kDa-1 n=1 Tax=Ictalurus punctatus TaxID=7998 RepID=B1NQN1_ICTPU|nr:warm temperature acclimation protein 65 KDa-1 [Ictalurus punctatus]
MRLLIQTFTICLALSLCLAAPLHHHEGVKGEKVIGASDHSDDHTNDHAHSDHGPNQKNHGPAHHDNDHSGNQHFDRCQELVFDAAIENKEGVQYFFKDNHVFKGFHGDGELTNKTFPELDDHLLGHVDAAVRVPSEDSPDHHEHFYFFLDDKVFSYENHKLEEGFPKAISEVFPGIPDHLDAAVECHKPDCPNNTVVFFKGHEIYHFDLDTKEVHEKEFKSMPNCSAAFRYAGHYYCFHGHDFSKFDPNTGEVNGKYPKEAREYFMSCPHYGDKTEEEHIEREQCSHVHLDAVAEDDDHDLFAFRGHHYLSKIDDKYHAGTVQSGFKGLEDEHVDAAFAHENHIHIIQDKKVYVYNISHTPGVAHTLRDGYPKCVKETVGLEGHIDAAFICPKEHILHVIQGDKIYDVNLEVEPHTHTEARPIPFKHVDTAFCGADGVSVVIDDDFYHYESPATFITSRILPVKKDVAKELLGCDHHV